MADSFRDTSLGYIVRHVSRGRYLSFPEERPDFQLPEAYRRAMNGEKQSHEESRPKRSEEDSSPKQSEDERYLEQEERESSPKRSEDTRVPSIHSAISQPITANTTVDNLTSPYSQPTVRPQKSGDFLKPPDMPANAFVPVEKPEILPDTDLPPDMGRIRTAPDLERALTQPRLDKTLSRPIVPTITSDGAILVDWYGPDDPANPQNWTLGRKFFIALQICVYTTSVYLGSAIYSASEGGVMQVFNVSSTKASLGLALYVLGCK